MADRRYFHSTRSGYPTWSVHPLAVPEVDCAAPNQLWAVPFYAGRGGTVSGLWLNVQGTAGSSEATLVRAGVYAAQTVPNPYPGTLLIDAGTAGACSSTGLYFPITTSFTEGRLYWLTTFNNVSSFAVQFRQGWHFPAVFGFSSDMNCYQATIVASYTFGTLPATFPASRSFWAVGPWWGIQWSS